MGTELITIGNARAAAHTGKVRIGIDSGGTFTDCVWVENGVLRVSKLFSTPHDAGLAVKEAVKTIAGGASAGVRHGTTVGTNALLERKGARVAFVTTAGFEDSIAIGRQARPFLYDWAARPEPCLIPPELRFGVKERVAADGTPLLRPTHLDLTHLRELVQASGAEAVAISLLFSFANPEHERLTADALRPLGLPLSVSHQILPEFREYERGSTVVVNAYLAPKVGGYLERLDAAMGGGSLDVMQSSGGIVPARFAAEQPVRTILSGPAGGVMGAYFAGQRAGYRKLIAFDMGGTSTDVSLIDMDAGGPHTTNEGAIAGMPVSVPTLDIHTVGAGGGSLVRFDEGGWLRVGPASAGAQPGPICYGRGTEPTVSDANVVLGRLHPDHFLGGAVKLDGARTLAWMEKARGPIASVEQFAAGITRVAETVMAQAIRVISVERGHDPREFTLVAFGGAGPLHACALAEELGMPRVLVPSMPGALSAVGILLSDRVREYSKTVMCNAEDDLNASFAELELAAEPGERHHSVDVRYRGQGYELNVEAGAGWQNRFHAAHRRRFGYADDRRPLEIVTVRLRVVSRGQAIEFRAAQEKAGTGEQARIGIRTVFFDRPEATAVYERDLLRSGDTLSGPSIIVEYSATTVLPPGWALRVDRFSNLILEAQG